MTPRFPPWLASPDPDRDPDYLRRAQWAYPSIVQQEQDRPFPFNDGYGDGPFTLDIALEWAEARARRMLG